MMMSRWVMFARSYSYKQSQACWWYMLWWTVQFSDHDRTRIEGGSCVAILEEFHVDGPAMTYTLHWSKTIVNWSAHICHMTPNFSLSLLPFLSPSPIRTISIPAYSSLLGPCPYNPARGLEGCCRSPSGCTWTNNGNLSDSCVCVEEKEGFLLLCVLWGEM